MRNTRRRLAVWFWGAAFVQSHTRRIFGHEVRSKRLTRFLYLRLLSARKALRIVEPGWRA